MYRKLPEIVCDVKRRKHSLGLVKKAGVSIVLAVLHMIYPVKKPIERDLKIVCSVFH